MSHERWSDLVDAFALGALDGEDLERFERHLAEGCPDCDRDIVESREILHGLARSLAPVEPPPHLKQRLLGRLGAESDVTPDQVGRPRGLPSWSRVAVAASLFLLASVAGVLALDDWAVRKDRRDLASEILQLRSSLANHKKIVWFLDDPEVQAVPLRAAGMDSRASGRVVWRASDGAGYFLGHGLPDPGPNQRYSLWAITAAGPVPAGLFSPDDLGRVQVSLPKLPTKEAGAILRFAVTLEPAVGSRTPTGPEILAGVATAPQPA
ncbi:MAG: anti-sigma factor [Isosphaeraceae bacterium]